LRARPNAVAVSAAGSSSGVSGSVSVMVPMLRVPRPPVAE
jgi:hypothetical protein